MLIFSILTRRNAYTAISPYTANIRCMYVYTFVSYSYQTHRISWYRSHYVEQSEKDTVGTRTAAMMHTYLQEPCSQQQSLWHRLLMSLCDIPHQRKQGPFLQIWVRDESGYMNFYFYSNFRRIHSLIFHIIKIQSCNIVLIKFKGLLERIIADK